MANIDISQLITREVKSAAVAEQTKGRIAARRYDAETGGMVINGMPIDTSRDSQALITGARVSGMDDPSYVCTWKTSQGPVFLDAETMAVIARAVRAHVQACFDREGVLIAAVDAGTYTDTMLDEGWPDYGSDVAKGAIPEQSV